MKGNRIEMAKSSLILFLKSLPPNSYFNVISFGTWVVPMYKASQKLSEENLESAISSISAFGADL